MKKIIILIVIGLSGCANLPKSIDDFKSGEYAVKNLCSEMSVKETHELLLNKLVQCYQGNNHSYIPSGNYMVALSVNTTVESYVNDNGTSRLAMRVRANQNQFYQQLVEITPAKHCAANIAVYEVTPAWERHTARIQSWLAGEEVSGCGVW